MCLDICIDGLVINRTLLYRWFEWDGEHGSEGHKLGVKPSDRKLTSLQDVKQQLALAFNNGGSILASGGEVDISILILVSGNV